MSKRPLMPALGLAAAAVLAAVGVAAGSASASGPPSQGGATVQAVSARINNCNCDVEIFTPAWHVEEQKPPLRTLLRPFVLVKLHHEPREFSSTMTLYHLVRVLTRHGLVWEPRRVKGATVARIGKGHLPRVGETVVWRFGGGVFPDWYCAPSRYFLVWAGSGVNHTGAHQRWLWYSPYLKGHGIADSGWGSRPPNEREAIHIRRC